MITDEWVIAVCVGEIQIETDWGIKYQKAICFVSQPVFSLVFLGFSFFGGCTFVCSLDLSPRSFSLRVLAYVFEQGLVDLRGSKGRCTSNRPTRCTSDRPASLLWCPPPNTHTKRHRLSATCNISVLLIPVDHHLFADSPHIRKLLWIYADLQRQPDAAQPPCTPVFFLLSLWAETTAYRPPHAVPVFCLKVHMKRLRV